MSARSASQRRAVRLSLAAAAITATVLAVGFSERIWVEWHTQRIVRVIRAHCSPLNSIPLGPGYAIDEAPELAALERWVRDEGEAAFPVLRRLLRHPEYRVWCHASGLVNSSASRAAFMAYLRSADDVALLRYVLQPPYQHGTDWRYWENVESEVRGVDAADASSGAVTPGAERLALGPQASRFLREVLEGEIEYQGHPEHFGSLQIRAVSLLGLAVDAGHVSPATSGPADSLGSPTSPLALLLHTAREHVDPDVRLLAIETLMRCRGLEPLRGTKETLFDFLEWTPANRDGVTALALVDHVTTLAQLIDIDRDPRTHDLVREVLEARQSPLPLPFPEWLPFERAALRFLDGTPKSRATAAYELARLGHVESRRVLDDKLRDCADPELARFYKACLVALGDAGWADEMAALFEERLAELERAYESGSYEDPSWLPESLTECTFCGDAMTLSIARLATLLLWAGRRDVLERVVADALNDGLVRVALEDHIESTAGVEESDAPGLLEPDLESWWAEHRDALVWDAATRTFRVE